MPHVVLPYPPQNRKQLWLAVQALFGVKIPRTRVCPDHCSPFDAFADAYFGTCTVRDGKTVPEQKVSRMIWHASRGLAGKSKTLSVLGLTLSYVNGADITILGGSMSQSANVHEYMTKGMEFENLPNDMVLDQTATKIVLSNKGRVRPLPASQKNVRGPHPSILLMDEVDEMEIGIYDAALGQPMPQPNYLEQLVPTLTVISSTWQNADGTLTEIFRRNEEKDNPDPIYRWCYKESSNEIDGWLTQQTIDEKRADVTAEMFRTEYDLGEPSIGNRAIDPEAVEAAFCLKFRPEDEVGRGAGYLEHIEKKDYEEFRFERYEKNGVYVAGADWAKEQDKTIIWVARLDDKKRRLVYFLRVNRRPYPVMIGYFNKALRAYKIPDRGSFHDSTGLGDVVDDYVDVRARPFPMTGDKRARLLNNYINALEKGSWEIPRIRSAYTEHKYCSVGDLYSSAQGFHLPDTVCAAALAEYAAVRILGQTLTAPQSVGDRTKPTKTEERFSHVVEDEVSELSPDPVRPFTLSV